MKSYNPYERKALHDTNEMIGPVCKGKENIFYVFSKLSRPVQRHRWAQANPGSRRPI